MNRHSTVSIFYHVPPSLCFNPTEKNGYPPGTSINNLISDLARKGPFLFLGKINPYSNENDLFGIIFGAQEKKGKGYLYFKNCVGTAIAAKLYSFAPISPADEAIYIVSLETFLECQRELYPLAIRQCGVIGL